MLRRLSLLLVTLWVVASTGWAEVIKSPNDPRDYRVVELSNGLKAVLVSDPKLDKAAAALSIQVGSNANPVDRAGLAHFLEHMLFLGTEKYPDADAYQAFIASNGGHHNAFTSYERTTYFFDISRPNYEGALDRFSQFFIAPLFNPEYVDRERNAVHSEFEAKKLDDGRRSYVADKRVMNPEHAWTAFSVGDLTTLHNSADDPIRDDLIEFYERYYSANLMTLALVAPDSLDQLEQLAESYFSQIPNREAEPYRDEVPLYLIEQLPVQLDLKTVKASRQLEISFPIPPRRDHWRSKPLYFIANQIGYEGEGSLLSYLKEQGWAESLGAWVGIDLPGAARFDISLTLTESGMEHYRSVVDAVFAEIELIRNQGLRPALYEEQRQLAETDFRFSEPGEAMHLATRLVQMLADYPEEELLRAPYLFEAFPETEISEYLDLLTPQRMILTRRSDALSGTQIESKYGIEHEILPIQQQDLARWSAPPVIAELSIRQSNPYIAEQFTIKPADVKLTKPQQLSSDPLVELWHLQDTEFDQPKGAVNLAILSPNANESAERAVATALLARMINEQLNESLYDARLAGFGIDLYAHSRGISLKIDGYDDKLLTLLTSSLQGLQASLVDTELFERLKTRYAEELANRVKEKPYNQTFAEVYEQLLPIWSDEARANALKQLELADLRTAREALLSEGQLRVLVHGNLTSDEALKAADLIQTELAQQTRYEPVAQLMANQVPDLEVQEVKLALPHHDSALMLYLQADDSSFKARAEVSLINELLSAPFYSELRTEQQLGYIVFSNYLPMAEQPGISLVVQSPVANSKLLKQAYLEFLEGWRAELPERLTTELERYKASVTSRLMKPSTRLSEETARFWRELDRENTDFDTREQIRAAIDSIRAEDLVERVEQLMNRPLWIAADPAD